MRCPPVQFDNAAFRATVNLDPIPRFVGVAETEHESGKNVVQAALERETEDDGNDAGGGEQALNGEIENIGDDGESRSQIDQGRENILNELTVTRAPFEDDHGSHQGDQEPSRPEPPRDFQYSRDRVAVGRASQLQRLIWNNRMEQQQQREQDEEDHS